MKALVKTFMLAAASATLAIGATPASAKKPDNPPAPKVNPPTLHGFCATADPCSDNGTNTPTDVNPPVFGFSSGGHNETGVVTIDILVPDNLAQPGSFTISGSLIGSNTFVASLFSPTAWTSGQLDDYLGISASPTNPIGAYLPTTVALGQNADGFWVYQATIGTVTLPSNGNASDNYLLTLDQSLGIGSYVVAFINQSGNYGATANSGAILETGGHTPLPEPATWAMMLVGFGGVGVAMRRSRRREKAVSQFA